MESGLKTLSARFLKEMITRRNRIRNSQKADFRLVL